MSCGRASQRVIATVVVGEGIASAAGLEPADAQFKAEAEEFGIAQCLSLATVQVNWEGDIHTLEL